MINLGLRNHCDYLWDDGTLLWTREIRVQNTNMNTNKYALFPRGRHIVNRKPFGHCENQHHHPTGENQFHWPCSKNPPWSLWLVHTSQNSETRQCYASITATGTLLTACHSPKATYHGVNSRSQFWEENRNFISFPTRRNDTGSCLMLRKKGRPYKKKISIKIAKHSF